MSKCAVEGCEEETEPGTPWCEKHLDKLGDFLEKNPIIPPKLLMEAGGRLLKQ